MLRCVLLNLSLSNVTLCSIALNSGLSHVQDKYDHGRKPSTLVLNLTSGLVCD
jgi:hypothetical protein